MQLSVATKNARADAITAAVGNAGKLRVYSGSAPATVEAAPTGTMLSEVVLGSPFAAAASGGVLSPTIPGGAPVVAGGPAGWWRVFKADGVTPVIQGTAGFANADMLVSRAVLQTSDPLQINSWTVTEG